MPEIRQRHNRSTASVSMDGEETDPFTPGAGLSASAMIDASPQHHGSVYKLHVPVFYSILPAFLQRIILSLSFLSWLAPSWKKRHLILCGSYLYKFNDTNSSVPKGSPFEVQRLTTDILLASERELLLPEIGELPEKFESIFTVSTLRRRHYYAVYDNEEARLWLRSLHETRQEVITRNMGHASSASYPTSWKHFDSLGKNLVKSKDRIKGRLERSNRDGMEMITFTDGQIPRGFYG